MEVFESLVSECRSNPREVAKKLVAQLSADELQGLVDRLRTEGAIMAEFREMLAEGRRVHQERKKASDSQRLRFMDSLDCWLAEPPHQDLRVDTHAA